jgi:hypothetical protein
VSEQFNTAIAKAVLEAEAGRPDRNRAELPTTKREPGKLIRAKSFRERRMDANVIN